MLEKRLGQRGKGLAYVFVRRDGAWLPTDRRGISAGGSRPSTAGSIVGPRRIKF